MVYNSPYQQNQSRCIIKVQYSYILAGIPSSIFHPRGSHARVPGVRECSHPAIIRRVLRDFRDLYSGAPCTALAAHSYQLVSQSFCTCWPRLHQKLVLSCRFAVQCSRSSICRRLKNPIEKSEKNQPPEKQPDRYHWQRIQKVLQSKSVQQKNTAI